jgi:sarcosine oxidase subunit gamma
MTRKENASMTDVVYESPLVGLGLTGPRSLQVDGQPCTLGEVPFVEMLNVRGNSGNPAFVSAVAQATGLTLPMQANTSSLSAHRQLLWLGPDEWLFKTRDGQGEAVLTALRTALAGQHAAVVAVGDGNTTFTVQGPAAAALLSRGCPLDLHPRVFGAGALAQSHIAKCGATVLCLQPGVDYELTVRRSFADYLFGWLSAAGA